MAKIKIKLTKEQQQYAVFAILALGGGGYAYFTYFWMPTSEKIVTTRVSIKAVQARINKAKGQAGRLKRIQRELAVLDEQAVDQERRLPKQRDLPSVIDTVSSLTKKYNAKLSGFAPGAATNKSHFIEVPYTLSLSATYHDLGRLLAAIALEERIFNVRDINFGGAGANGMLTVNLTLISYQYKG
ncbi:MAG: type 4a pilus biogenesis protein PilO [Elusimicrobiota bacterium]